MQKYIKHIVLIIATITMGYYIYLTYQRSKTAIEEKVTLCFDNAANSDLMLRIEKAGGKTSWKKIPTPKYKNIEIITENGRETFHFQDSLDVEIIYKLADQYTLAKICPINPVAFDSIFNALLEEQDLHLKTAMAYTYKGVTQYSDSNFEFLAKAFHTPLYTVDIKKEILIQGFAEITFWSILKRMETSLLVLLGIWLGSMIAICYILRSTTKEEVKDETLNEEENPIAASHIINFKNISLDTLTETLYINGKEKKIYQSDYKLLLMFLTAPNHTLSRREIMDQFWTEKEACDNRVNTAVSRLRAILKESSELELVNYRGAGYFLK